MALPNQLKSARMSDSTVGNQIDNEVGNLEKALADILGIPIDTNISAALFVVVAAGLQRIVLQNAAADPAAAGQFLRNATLLKYHDGSAVQTLARLADIGSTTNAYGTRTVSTGSPTGGNDGDIWYRY